MKQYILVAGVDYDFKGVDFRLFCNNRMKRTLDGNRAKEDMTFQIFDFRKGEVVTHEITYTGGKQVGKTTKLSPSPFKSISKANYDRYVIDRETHYRFKDGQRDKLSILDIYKSVQKIGVDAPHTLAELSFYSHGFYGGPLLVNSYDDGQVNQSVVLPSGARDPDDMDPRVKDFNPPIIDAIALTNFQNAFHADGFVWIWGCAFPRLVHEILHKIEHNSSYKESGLGDEELFRIKNFNTSQADYLESWVKDALGGPFPNKKNIEIKFKFLRYFFCQMIETSYLHYMSVNAKVKAYGALIGTYAEYDTGRLPLMHIYRGFARHFAFYKNYLGFNFDPEGRKYGEYRPDFTCTVPRP